MVCVQCGDKTQVINTRPQLKVNQQWRRRQCQSCKAIFSTLEVADYSSLWTVKAPSGPLRPFNRDKLLLTLHHSLQHRSKSLDDAAGLVNTVIAKLRSQAVNGVLTTQQISQTVQVALNRFDKVASVHYQAMHNRESSRL